MQAPRNLQDLFRPGPFFVIFSGIYALSFLIPVAWIDRHPSPCLFRATTGLPCPGCGLSRSFVHTAHRDLHGAMRYHFFGPVLFFLGILALAIKLADDALGLRLIDRLERTARRPMIWFAPGIAWWGYALLRLGWIWLKR